MRAPDLLVGDLIDCLPGTRVDRVLAPARPQIAIEQLGHVVADPASGVNAIGHRIDRDILCRISRPQILKHAPCDPLVELADRVPDDRMANGAFRHVERLIGRIGTSSAEEHEIVQIEADLADEVAPILADQPTVEDIKPSRHGRMRCEDVRRPGDVTGFFVRAAVLLHENRAAFQRHERRMALVHVADARFNAHGKKRPISAYP